MNDLPFIFFAFANSEKRYLPYLRKESQGILDYFCAAKFERGILDFFHKEEANSKDFFNLIRQAGNKINILHYSGHANSFMMDLVDDDYSIKQLSLLISELDNLQLVFLNGCSTKAMVDTLLEKGVKAVIATSEDIDDNKACDFSISFYKSFVQKGKTLEQAFKIAASTLKKNPIKEADLFISRSLRKSKYKGNTIPWALYYRDEDKAHLKWKLIKNTTSIKIEDPALKDERERIQEKIGEQKIKIGEYTEKVKKWKTTIPESVIANTPVIAQQIKEDEEELKSAKATLHNLYTNLSNLLATNSKATLKKDLDSALFKLNFIPQISAFNKHTSGQKNLFGIILQGTAFCGQDMLKERLINAGRNYTKDYPQIINIEFKANSIETVNKKSIWSRILVELDDIKSDEPVTILEEIYDNYFLHKDLVFIFENIQRNSAVEISLSIIQQFWSKVLEVFSPKIQAQPTANKVLFLVIDRQCILQKEAHFYTSDKEAQYKEGIKNRTSFEQSIDILPMIEPLFYKNLTTWKASNNLPNYLLSEEILQQVVAENGSPILPTIKKICTQANMTTLYQSKYQKYTVKDRL